MPNAEVRSVRERYVPAVDLKAAEEAEVHPCSAASAASTGTGAPGITGGRPYGTYATPHGRSPACTRARTVRLSTSTIDTSFDGPFAV